MAEIPKFIYFDLGNVLVNFSTDRMLRQMGEAAGVEPMKIRDVVFGSGLQRQLETGRITAGRFYETFCEATGAKADYDALVSACNDIFELNLSMLPVVAVLRQAGYRLGILSNTCRHHWEHCRKRFRIIDNEFSTYALSYRIGAMKPSGDIFHAAAELAGVEPGEIFFADDIAEHVAGARAAGLDAVQYTSTPQLVVELHKRGVQFNY